ncbi:MAG: MBL fold metallo-hydrolase [Lentisphaerae bacterium]|nr:MBL fold metallo-hydrolase [Lentisphaerota bacterium]
MKVCVLASGSSGNCIYVGSDSTQILIDAGLSGRATRLRLEQLGVDLAAIQAICLTHEHCDHVAGLSTLHTRHGMALYANAGTIEAMQADKKKRALRWQVFTTGARFAIGDLILEPFAVSHDAYEPVGFVVQRGPVRVGIVTDIGMSTHLVRERLKPCQALVIESNHDEHLLSNTRRPWSLKQRIAGRQGHLSNKHAADLVAEVSGPGLQQVFLAHLSSECNRPELALQTMQTALQQRGQAHIQVHLTFPDRNSALWKYDQSGRQPCSPANGGAPGQ